MFLVKSQVPSPTVKVSDEYELEPGGERASAGAMAAVMGAVDSPVGLGKRIGEAGRIGYGNAVSEVARSGEFAGMLGVVCGLMIWRWQDGRDLEGMAGQSECGRQRLV